MRGGSAAEISSAKQAAKRIFKKYNFQGGELGQYELSSLLKETYQHLNIQFRPNSTDIKQYRQVLDNNSDGKVTLDDLQAISIKFLCEDKIQILQSSHRKFQKPVQYIPIKDNSYQKYEASFSGNQQIPQAKFQQKNNNSSTAKQFFRAYSDINKNPSSQQNSRQNQQLYIQYHGKDNQQYGQSIEQYQKQDQYQSKNVNNQQHQHSEINNKGYNQQVLQYLDISRQIFYKYSLPQSQTITSNEVPNVLSQTYAALGRQGYKPSADDVAVWMKLCDSNGDGHVQYEQYQYFVVRSLERSGINIYQAV